MPVTNYYTVNSSIVGEKTTGGSRIDYLTDILGSVTATVNQSAQVRNTYRYKPYGATLAKTGTDPDPTFGWVGTQGYRPTQKKFSDFYVRARHADSATGRWSTVDPIGLYADGWNLYAYAVNNPVIFVDPSGLFCLSPGNPPCQYIGNPSKSGEECPNIPGTNIQANGCTNCNPKTGKPYSIFCPSTLDPKSFSLLLPCVQTQEAANRNAQSDCCAKYQKCLANNSAKVCYDRYNMWVKSNAHLMECIGAKAFLECTMPLKDKYCNTSSNDFNGPKCEFYKYYLNAAIEILSHCAKLPKPTTCKV